MKITRIRETKLIHTAGNKRLWRHAGCMLAESFAGI